LVDGNAEKALRKLYTMDGAVSLSDQDRYYFAVFINSLRIRTPEAFQSNAESAERILRERLIENDPRLEEDDIKSTLDGQTLLEWTEKYHKVILENIGYEYMAKFIIDEKFVARVEQMTWTVVKRVSDITNFLTSDRPLVLIGSIAAGNLGFAIAISPDRVFICTSKPESLARVLEFSAEKFIEEMNKSTIQQAKGKAFARDKSHSLRFFERRLGVEHHILPWTTLSS
jgi:hypothetical protein